MTTDALRSDRTPDGAFYGARAFAAQRELVFARTWHLLAPAAGAPRETGAAPAVLLPGTLDEPLVLTRDGDGRRRLLANVCTHRGNVIASAAQPCRALRCGYHGRTFGLDGRVRGAPGFEDVPGFPDARDHLPEVPLGEWLQLAFAAVAPAVPFAEWIAPVAAAMAHLGPLPQEPASERSYEFDGNWALYVDNYLEGLHIPYVHPSLSPLLDWTAYEYEMLPWGTLQIGRAAADADAMRFPPGHRFAGERLAALWFWLFPATMLNFYPWGVSLNAIEPLGEARTRVRYQVYVTDAARRQQAFDLGQVEREDQAVVGTTQRGIHSRFYRGGRYAPSHERGVQHFHALLRAMLGRDGSGSGDSW
jgi:choline monooxygenase